MFQPSITRAMRFAAPAAGALALVLGTALPAMAAGTITSPTSGAVIASSSSPTTVSGAISSPSTRVFVVHCVNGSAGAQCSINDAAGTVSGSTWTASVPVATTFTPYDYTSGPPDPSNPAGPPVTCRTSSTDTTPGRVNCSFQASFYPNSGPPNGFAEVQIYVS